MADDTQRAKARATFGSTFFENAKPTPPAKNFATAQQKTANSRPIPTFKVGGAVKKAEGGLPRNRAMPYERPSRPMTPAEVQAAKAVKMGPKPAPKVPDRMYRGASERGDEALMKPTRKAAGGLPEVRKAAIVKRAAADAGSPVTGMGAPALKPMKKGGKVQTSSDTARKLAKEMGGMKKGGACAPMKPQQKSIGGVLRAVSPIVAAIGAAKGNKALMGLGALGMGAGLLKGKKKLPGALAKVAETASSSPSSTPAPTSIAPPTPTPAPASSPAPAPAPAPASAAATPAARPAAPAPRPVPRSASRPAAPAPRPAMAAPAPRPAAPAAAPRPAAVTPVGRPPAPVGRAAAAARPAAAPERSFGADNMQKYKAMMAASRTSPAVARSAPAAVSGKTPYQMSRDMTQESNSMRSNAPASIQEAVNRVRQGEAARNASRSERYATDAKRRGEAVTHFLQGKDYYESHPEERPGYLSSEMKKGGKVGKYAVGGAGKTRKGQAPIKKAQGGAAKVRKGMMTPKGQITPGVKPHKGIGGF